MSLNVLGAGQFLCSTAAECRASHPGEFFEGQLHHLGAHYDLSVAGNPFRVVVVGQEYGNGPARVVREARTHDVLVKTGQQKRFRTDGVHAARNPHMRGTTSLLRLLFGGTLGDDYSGEFLLLDNRRVHTGAFPICSDLSGQKVRVLVA